jgi:hypothetical protein
MVIIRDDESYAPARKAANILSLIKVVTGKMKNNCREAVSKEKK